MMDGLTKEGEVANKFSAKVLFTHKNPSLSQSLGLMPVTPRTFELSEHELKNDHSIRLKEK